MTARKALPYKKEKVMISALSHEGMCRAYRFAPVGHPWFIADTYLWAWFCMRFSKFGGMTTEMSKKIGLRMEGEYDG